MPYVSNDIIARRTSERANSDKQGVVMSSEGSIGARNNEATANSQAEPILTKKQA